LIFTTAFEEFAIQAFEVNAIDYLLKPFSKDRFDKAIHRLQERSRSTPSLTQLLETAASDLPVHHHRVVVKSNGKIIIIPTTDIQFLEASDDYVRIKSSQGVFLKNRTMAHFEKTFDPKHFIRVHRSYMVNVSEIAKIENGDKDSWIILLKQGGHIPVSKSGYSKLRSALGL
jgi:two-component system LytT family response regulator